MPQMGESIAEGTIVRWIKKVGDPIDKDEPLFEISTDKVDAEIPSPGAGVILEISVKEGETVPVNSVVARIGAAGEKPAAPASAHTENTGPAQTSKAAEPPADGSSPSVHKTAPPKTDERVPPAPQHPSTPAPQHPSTPAPQHPETLEDLRRRRSSPVVRKIAKEHGVD